jgi:hypothetical protein
MGICRQQHQGNKGKKQEGVENLLLEIETGHGRIIAGAARKKEEGRRKKERLTLGPEIAENHPGIDGQRQEAPVFGENFLKRGSVVEDHVIGGKGGSGDMAAVGAAVDRDLIVLAAEVINRLMHQDIGTHEMLARDRCLFAGPGLRPGSGDGRYFL